MIIAKLEHNKKASALKFRLITSAFRHGTPAKPRAYALDYAGVPPLQGSSTSSLSIYYFDTLALVLCNGFHEVKKKYLSLHRASLKVYPL